MPGNTLGHYFRVTSYGESHGPALGCIIDGCPPGFSLSESLIQPYLDKRRPGQSKFTTQRREPDRVKILSGVFEGQTTGAPIGLMIENTDQRSRDYSEIKDKFRPGHADYTYHHKYGVRDYRGGGRSSARETAMRVAAGAVARQILQQIHGITIYGYLAQLGSIVLDYEDSTEVDNNVFFCPNRHQIQDLEQAITALRKQGDSIGARVNVLAEGVPVGWGDPVFDRLDATIAHAMMSINAAKGVEIGAGFHSVVQKGSEHRDEMNAQGFLSNQAGGILGGISTGQAIEVSVAFKPTSSIVKPGKTVTVDGKEVEIVTKGRHDPCVGIRAVPIVEAMLALVLIDHFLSQRALRGE